MPALLVDMTEFMNWPWSQIQPLYDELAARPLDASNVDAWLTDWSEVTDHLDEAYSRLYVATTVNTVDELATDRFNRFLDTIFQPFQEAEQRLKQKLLDSSLQPAGMHIAVRNMRAETEIYRAENLALQTREQKLVNEYQKIVGAQTVMWEGKETTIAQLQPVYQNPDRGVREKAWRLAAGRQLQDRKVIGGVWTELLRLRRQLAANAGLGSYLDYRWKQLLRFDYTPENARQFHNAIEQVVVPAAGRVYERGRRRLGLDRLRPWDLTAAQGFGNVVAPPDRPPLAPFRDVSELEARAASMFHRVDPILGAYFETMRREGLLDLANRKNKAPGAYCMPYESTQKPFIFANSVGLHRDVQTVLHESGHAFHVFETRRLPYYQQRSFTVTPMEFAEVGSMGMELLAAPYLPESQGGFYSDPDAARARRDHLEELLIFWPYMAVVDSFQHWIYQNVDQALEPSECDSEWQRIWDRFMIGVDWNELDDVCATRWQRQLHIHSNPFYYIEYGLAQLGAVQVWRNARADQAGAVAAYRRALALGTTVTLPELYAAAGARFAFDPATLGEAVELIEETIDELDR